MRSRSALNLIVIVLGLGALSLLVREVGVAQLLDQLWAVRGVFALVLLSELLSNTASTAGWYYGFPQEGRPAFLRTLSVSFASLAVAGALPTGQASEVTKWNLMRGLSPAQDLVASLVVFNYLHVLVTFLVVLVGPLAALTLGSQLPVDLTWTTAGVALAGVLVTAAGGVLLARGSLAPVLRRTVGRFLGEPRRVALVTWASGVDASLRGAAARRGDLARAVAWLAVGRVFSVLEIAVILWALLPDTPLLVTSLMVFSTTAVVNYVLLVLPAREGFLEASTAGVFTALGLSGAVGLSLEITRRLRKIVFQIAGLGLMMALGRQAAARCEPDSAP